MRSDHPIHLFPQMNAKEPEKNLFLFVLVFLLFFIERPLTNYIVKKISVRIEYVIRTFASHGFF